MGETVRSTRSVPVSTGPRSELNRRLAEALIVDARQEVALAMRVGVLSALDHSRAEIAQETGATPAEVRAAFERVRRAIRHLRD